MSTIPRTPGQRLAIQNPVQASDASAVNGQEVTEYIRGAIAAGSWLPNPSDETLQTARVTRRALIVAPIYTNDPSWSVLNTTATDVMLVHKMLVRCGYEKRNIWVLCDICSGFLGLADPTRENILSSLERLTSNTQTGDYRFFHFSGHGEHTLQEKDIRHAKRARRVHTGSEPTLPGDYERYSSIREPQRITEQTIPEKELAYYNEG
ncbi:hypothetical protein FRC06_007484 [Ceratobasidium sp. 370]|nr:hypothetical protein FRC06_007484 [Ceratobasidium sp. 370]